MSFLGEVSKVLYKTKLSSLFLIKKHGFKLRYFPTKVSKRLWVDSFEKKNIYGVIDKFYFDCLKPGAVVIDVGANIGYHTLLSVKIVGSQGYVYSIEAHPRIYSYLEKNIALNKCKNISTYNLALGNKKEKAILSDKSRDDLNRVSSDAWVVVSMDRLDNIAIHHNKIDLLKIDVEGYEKFVMEGSLSILEKTETVFFESWDKLFKKYDYTLKEIFIILDKFGFTYLVDGENGYEVIDENFTSDDCVDIVATKIPHIFVGHKTSHG